MASGRLRSTPSARIARQVACTVSSGRTTRLAQRKTGVATRNAASTPQPTATTMRATQSRKNARENRGESHHRLLRERKLRMVPLRANLVHMLVSDFGYPIRRVHKAGCEYSSMTQSKLSPCLKVLSGM